MKLNIEHELDYQYTNAVFLEPHYLYLHPKRSSLLTLLSHEIEITPPPSTIAKNLDSSDNIQYILFFKDTTSSLNIKVNSLVETTEFNPLSFLYHPFESSSLPIKYSDDLEKVLSPYLVKDGITTLIDQTARQIAASVNWNTTAFLTTLNSYINQFSYEIREDGLPNTPETTLLSKQGSCRDYSVLYMAMCRVLGVAARFVSGYHYVETENLNSVQHLHAWVEVYLPGGGWRGFDPTQNCLVSGNHVPVGASAIPQMVTPIKGTFRGSAVSVFEAKVKIIPT
ncbi:MAG: transglutaminase family protein [Arcicella sp.]|nr:transglutaminase family protein [Arcicella sp.]